jgi:hypothetical protein
LTFVDTKLTVQTSKTSITHAYIVITYIYACTTVEAIWEITVVYDIVVTQAPVKPTSAIAGEVIDSVNAC